MSAEGPDKNFRDQVRRGRLCFDEILAATIDQGIGRQFHPLRPRPFQRLFLANIQGQKS
jgi:hypothetical protein